MRRESGKSGREKWSEKSGTKESGKKWGEWGEKSGAKKWDAKSGATKLCGARKVGREK